MKTCTRCHEPKEANAMNFPAPEMNSWGKPCGDGYASWCRACHRAYNKARRRRIKTTIGRN